MDRRRYLGGSDAAAVVGVDPRRTPLDLWTAKVADEPPPPPDPKLAKFFARRKRQEPVVAEMLQDEGVEVTKLSWGEPNRYSDPELPWAAAEIDFEARVTPALRERFPDRQDFAALPDGTLINGEIKTAHFLTASRFGEEGSEDFPVEYAAQVQHGLMVTRRPACLVAVLIGVDDLTLFPTMADVETIAWMRGLEVAFWAKVEARTPPPPTTLEDISRLYARFAGKPVNLTTAGAAAVRRIFEIREEMKALEKENEAQKFQVFDEVRAAWGIPADPTVEMPGDNAVLRYGGTPIAVWRRQAGASLDQKRLAVERPEIIEQYTRRTTFRVLALPPKPKRGKS